MKCVCPMGGDRTCPDDCFIAIWHSLPDDQKTKERRRPIVESLTKQKYSPEAIAAQLGVGVATIYRDIGTFITVINVKGKGKDTLGRKKSTGRPKGGNKKTTPAAPAQDPVRVTATTQEWEDFKRAQEEAGRKASEVLGAVVKGVEIDPATLSSTAQQKLDAAIRQHKRKLDLEFEQRVLAECRIRIEEIVLPRYTENQETHLRVIKARNGVMNRSTYKKILACLHPDRVQGTELQKKYEEAFRLFTEMEKVLLDEKESPTSAMKMPRTYEEMMEMKRKVSEERKAKRSGKSSVSQYH